MGYVGHQDLFCLRWLLVWSRKENLNSLRVLEWEKQKGWEYRCETSWPDFEYATDCRRTPHMEPNTSCLRVLGSAGAGCVSMWMQKKPFISHPGVQLCIRPHRLTSHLSQTMQFLHVSLDISPLIYAKLKYMFFQRDRSEDIRKWENQHFPW